MHDADRYETISIQNGKNSLSKKNIYRMCMRLPIIKTLAFSFLKSFVSLLIHHGRISQE